MLLLTYCIFNKIKRYAILILLFGFFEDAETSSARVIVEANLIILEILYFEQSTSCGKKKGEQFVLL